MNKTRLTPTVTFCPRRKRRAMRSMSEDIRLVGYLEGRDEESGSVKRMRRNREVYVDLVRDWKKIINI